LGLSSSFCILTLWAAHCVNSRSIFISMLMISFLYLNAQQMTSILLN
jgi:hypothetical protein